MDMVARRDAADLMKKHKPENLGDFFECAEAEGHDDDHSSLMWKTHLNCLKQPGYRALAGLAPLTTQRNQANDRSRL